MSLNACLPGRSEAKTTVPAHKLLVPRPRCLLISCFSWLRRPWRSDSTRAPADLAYLQLQLVAVRQGASLAVLAVLGAHRGQMSSSRRSAVLGWWGRVVLVSRCLRLVVARSLRQPVARSLRRRPRPLAVGLTLMRSSAVWYHLETTSGRGHA